MNKIVVSIFICFFMMCTKSTHYEGFIEFNEESTIFKKTITDKDLFWVKNNNVMHNLYEELSRNFIADSSRYQKRTIHVSLIGKMYPKGEYGHLGKFKQQIEIIEVIQFSIVEN